MDVQSVLAATLMNQINYSLRWCVTSICGGNTNRHGVASPAANSYLNPPHRTASLPRFQSVVSVAKVSGAGGWGAPLSPCRHFKPPRVPRVFNYILFGLIRLTEGGGGVGGLTLLHFNDKTPGHNYKKKNPGNQQPPPKKGGIVTSTYLSRGCYYRFFIE